MGLSSLKLPVSGSRGELKKLEWDEPLSPLAKLFFQRVRPDDHDFVIHAVIGLEAPVDVSLVRTFLSENIVKLRRFSSIVLQERTSWNGYRWIPVEVDLDSHVEEVDLAQFTFPSSADPVAEYANSIVSRPLDPTRPLWEVHVLRHPSRGSVVVAGGSLLFRIHHSLGDGISLASLFLELAPTSAGTRAAFPLPRPPRTSSSRPLLHRAFVLAMMLWNTLLSSMKLLFLLLLPPDRRSPVKVPHSVRHLPRRYVFSPARAIELVDVKTVASVAGATVNDVMLAAISLAIHAYHRQLATDNEDGKDWKPPPPPLPTMRTLAMVNLREPLNSAEISTLLEGGTSAKWGTKVGYVLLRLPHERGGWWDRWARSSAPSVDDKGGGDVGHALLRIQAVRDVSRQTLRTKCSWEASLSSLLMRTVATLISPYALLRLILVILHKVTVGVSNLAGPQEEVLFLGSKVTSLHQFVGGVPMGASVHLFSYAGEIGYTISAHVGTLKDPELLSSCLIEVVKNLVNAAEIVRNLPRDI